MATTAPPPLLSPPTPSAASSSAAAASSCDSVGEVNQLRASLAKAESAIAAMAARELQELRELRAEAHALRASLLAAEATITKLRGAGHAATGSSQQPTQTKPVGRKNAERAVDALFAMVCAVFAVAWEPSATLREKTARTAVWAVETLWPTQGNMHEVFERCKALKVPAGAFSTCCAFCGWSFTEQGPAKPRARLSHANGACGQRARGLLMPRAPPLTFTLAASVPRALPRTTPDAIAGRRPSRRCKVAQELIAAAVQLLGRADALAGGLLRWVVRSRPFWVAVKLGVHLRTERAAGKRKRNEGLGGSTIPYAEFVGRVPLKILLVDGLGLTAVAAATVLDALVSDGPGFSVKLAGRMQLVTSKAAERRTELKGPYIGMDMPEIAEDSEIGTLINLELRVAGEGAVDDPLSVEETLYFDPSFPQGFVLHADLVLRDDPSARLAPCVVGRTMYSFSPAVDRAPCPAEPSHGVRVQSTKQ